jgi:hypothetical protein
MIKTYNISAELMGRLLSILNDNWFISTEEGDHNNDPIIEITHELEVLAKEQDDKRKDCCKNPENLELQPSDKPDLTIFKCRICQCRHFELSMDAGKLGVSGKEMR